MDKKSLRDQLLSLRQGQASQTAEAGKLLSAVFLSHLVLPPHALVAAYKAEAGEMDPAPLCDALEAAGHRLCLPCEVEKGQPLVFRSYHSGDVLQLGPRWAIRQPLPNVPVVVPDVLLVPLVGFDRQGNRLGQGGGYYDRTLAALRVQKTVLAIGLAYACQEVEAIPCALGDVPLDGVITPAAWIDCRKVN